MFSNARNVLITGGTFIEQHNVHHHAHTTRNDPSQRGWELLSRSIARGAFHNSADRYDPPKCYPGTREAVLNRILEWLHDSGNPHALMWMYGPAGSGKSAIAQTLAEKCHKAGILAASFFFSRTAQDRNNEKLLISTLSYQLCTLIPQMREYVGKAVDQDPSILARSLDTQMRELIAFPLNDVAQDEDAAISIQSRVKLIIVDGLDECSDGKTQRRIIDALSTTIHELNIPIFLFVASRPEHHIKLGFNAKDIRSMMIGLALDDDYRAFNDIHLFLAAKFAEIKDEHPLGSYLPHIWPTESELGQLVLKSSGQFIYIATILKYIESHRHRPEERLATVLSLSSSKNDTPFAELDTLYRQILSSVDNANKVLEILQFIILTAHLGIGGPRLPSSFVESILGYKPGGVKLALADMQSIIGGGESRPLYLHHASLEDFLLDQSRSREFFVDVERSHAYLAQNWINYISQNQTNPPWVFLHFLEHCSHAYLTPALLNDLQGVNLDTHFSELAIEDMLMSSLPARWHLFLRWLKSQRDSSTGNERLYVDQLKICNEWVKSKLLKYPVEIRSNIAAAMTLQGFSAPRSRSLMTILTNNMSESQIEEILLIDKEAFLFAFKRPPNQVLDPNWDIISDFVLGVSDEGDEHNVKEETYTALAYKTIEFLFAKPPQKEDVLAPPYRGGFIGEAIETPVEVALKLIPLVLPKASRDSNLADRLRYHASQFTPASSFHKLRENLSAAAEEYFQSIPKLNRNNPPTSEDPHVVTK